jgi:hypothetical protein
VKAFVARAQRRLSGVVGDAPRRRLAWLAVFAVAMAWFEAALVVYLRALIYPDNAQSIFPLRLMPAPLVGVELGRELATMAMLVAVAVLVEHSRGRRVAVFFYLFGLWDIFYYVWLEVMIGWPNGWLEWDVLYLIPWVWLGPWICPALISTVFVAWSGRVLNSSGTPRFGRRRVAVFGVGGLLALASFLEPAAGVLLRHGVGGLDGYTPGGFWWPVCAAGVVVMALGLPWVDRTPE